MRPILLPLSRYCLNKSYGSASCLQKIINCSIDRRDFSTDVSDIITEKNLRSQKNLSNAMKVYLQRAKEYDQFIEFERNEYYMGKRHLANMMGADQATFTQDDVNKAIEYLFPSGLFEKKARPIMDAPEKIFPPKKAAQFDESGRPFHSIFYTIQPNFYSALYDIVEHLEKLNEFEDNQITQGLLPNESHKFEPSASDWLAIGDLEKKFLEPISEKDYSTFTSAAQRLADHPYSAKVADFLMQFRVLKKLFGQEVTIPPLEYDENGRPFIIVKDAQKFKTTGTIKLIGNGTGKFNIHGKDISFFDRRQQREQVLFPLIFTGMENSIDVEVTYDSQSGESAYASIARWGISWGLRSFVDKKMVEKMRIAGLLTKDWRRRERKKPGQEGKRRKFTWRKR